MHLFPYRKEDDPEIRAAAAAAYREAPPACNTRTSQFARATHRDQGYRYGGPADLIDRGDHPQVA